jgi:hypothetical protein
VRAGRSKRRPGVAPERERTGPDADLPVPGPRCNDGWPAQSTTTSQTPRGSRSRSLESSSVGSLRRAHIRSSGRASRGDRGVPDNYGIQSGAAAPPTGSLSASSASPREAAFPETRVRLHRVRTTVPAMGDGDGKGCLDARPGRRNSCGVGSAHRDAAVASRWAFGEITHDLSRYLFPRGSCAAARRRSPRSPSDLRGTNASSRAAGDAHDGFHTSCDAAWSSWSPPLKRGHGGRGYPTNPS